MANSPIGISIFPPMRSRPCHFCLSLQGGAVFADFGIDEDNHVFLIRISFDGYGCCECSETSTKMDTSDSKLLVAMINNKELDQFSVNALLRTYLGENKNVVWADALEEYELL